MRQNLTNVKEIDIKDVEHFYVVGSTTKEGLIEGKSNVKLDLKKAVSGGGGPSSEDAERMYEALFGQTPYVAVARSEVADEEEERVVLVPLYEIFAGTGIAGQIANNKFFFKSNNPVPKATMMDGDDTGKTYIVFPPPNTNIYMMEMSAEMTGMPDTWYMSVEYDISLVGYTAPTSVNPITVSGTLPNKDEIEVLMSDHPVFGENPTETYHWDSEKGAFVMYMDIYTYYMLRQSDNNVIEWSFYEEIS